MIGTIKVAFTRLSHHRGNTSRWSWSGDTSSVRGLSAYPGDSWQPFWVKNLFTNQSALKKRLTLLPETVGVREFSLCVRDVEMAGRFESCYSWGAFNSSKAASDSSVLFFSDKELEGKWQPRLLYLSLCSILWKTIATKAVYPLQICGKRCWYCLNVEKTKFHNCCVSIK